jgi:hypothetical protein
MLCVCPVKKMGMTPGGASLGMAGRELGKVNTMRSRRVAYERRDRARKINAKTGKTCGELRWSSELLSALPTARGQRRD